MLWAYDDVHSYAPEYSSRDAPARSAVGFGLERPPGQRHTPHGSRRRLHPKEPQAAPVRSRWTGGSPVSIPVMVSPAYWMELGAIGREERHSVAWRAVGDASRFCRPRHFLGNPAFRPR